jgi:outer membrane protein OmpA-like peptidoglycan-associated protein
MSEGPFPVAVEEEDTPWVSVSDLMSGLMIIFLCIAVLFMHEQEKSITQQKEIAQQYEQVQGSLADALVKEFEKSELERWGAELVGDGLVVRFKDPSTMFTLGDDQLTPGFQTILAEFFPQLVSVLRHDEFRPHVREVRIEGHTSSEWLLGEGGEFQEGQTYLLNMGLSQRRAFSVLDFVLSRPAGIAGMEGDLRKWLRATGLSSSQPIPVAGGTAEDKNRSRRVEFRLVTDAEEAMSRIVEQVTGAAKQ